MPDLEGGDIEAIRIDDPIYDYMFFEIGQFMEKINNVCEEIVEYYPPPIR